MKKKSILILVFVMAVIMMYGSRSLSVSAEIGSENQISEEKELGIESVSDNMIEPIIGFCGELEVNEGKNISYTIKDSNSDGIYDLLEIQGSGNMASNAGNNLWPWQMCDNNNRIRLEKVILSEGIIYIGNCAFSGCSSLNQIIIPKSLVSIGSYAFEGCGSLDKINLSESIRFIGNSAFKGCGALIEIIIPESVEFIGDNAFFGCNSLREVVIPVRVSSIESGTFSGCSSLRTIVIPPNITSIKSYAFEGCRSLSEILLPEGIEIVEWGTFSGCSSLKEIVIPRGVANIENNAFSGCSSLKKIIISDDVTSIGDNAFIGCCSLKRVVIPKNVTSIGNWAFKGCNALTEVTLPNSIDSIGIGVFEGCSSLTNITIPNGVTSIGCDAFSDCTLLTRVVLPERLVDINHTAFAKCVALTEISFPNSITGIGWCAFWGCNSLNEIVIPQSVTTIGFSAFGGSSINQIFIPDNSITIESGAIPDTASEIKYVINEKGSVTITNIKIGDGQTLVQIHDTLGEYPVMSVAKEFRHLVSEEGHTHRYDDRGICQICDKRKSGHHHTGDDMRPPHDIPKGPDTWKDKEGIDAFVCRLYNIALIRDGEREGLEDWINRLDTKKESAAEVAWGFFFSDEFLDKNYTNEQYIELLYLTMFGRGSDEAGKSYWLECLENGVSREYIYRGFAESPEFTGLCGDFGVERGTVDLNQYRDQNIEATGFIARLYTQILGRSFDDDGIEYWCQEYLGKDRSIEEIAADGFLHSQEFTNQNLSNREFVIRMYRTFLNREPDEEGLADWVNRLENGRETRDSLVYGFTRSKEFGNFKEAYGL